MKAVLSLSGGPLPHGHVPHDIVSLRLWHCRAEQAALAGHYHLAVQHYHCCLEAAETRQDARATEFFALRLAECYDAMHLSSKAGTFRALAAAADVKL